MCCATCRPSCVPCLDTCQDNENYIYDFDDQDTTCKGIGADDEVQEFLL